MRDPFTVFCADYYAAPLIQLMTRIFVLNLFGRIKI